MQKRPPERIRIAWLMADYPLGYQPLSFGQFALLRDFALYWKDMPWGAGRVPIEQFYVGSRVTGDRAIACPDPTRDENAYLEGVQELCASNGAVIAMANFIHKDSAALAGLCQLEQQHRNLALIVALHCTRDEFLGRHRQAGSSTAGSRAERRAQRLSNFQASLPRLGREDGAAAFVAVSQAALSSYASETQAGFIPADRTWVIPNGVDARHYRLLSEPQRARRRARVGVDGTWTVGISSRWTQAKGKDILEALLDHLEEDPRWTFLAPALIHDQLFDFLARLPERWPRLIESGRIRLYLDLSHYRRGTDSCNRQGVRALYLKELASQPEEIRRVFERTFVGFLDFPVYHLMDVYLRPSVAEAFGLGPVESYLCGVPVLASDRDGLVETVVPDHRLHLDERIHLLGDEPTARSASYEVGVREAAGRFYARMCDRQSWQVPGEWLRRRAIELGLTTPRMLSRYNRLIRSLLSKCG